MNTSKSMLKEFIENLQKNLGYFTIKPNITLVEMFGIICMIFLGIWLWNAIKFTYCDFESDFKCEVIHGVGLVIPGTAVITVWFNTDN